MHHAHVTHMRTHIRTHTHSLSLSLSLSLSPSVLPHTHSTHTCSHTCKRHLQLQHVPHTMSLYTGSTLVPSVGNNQLHCLSILRNSVTWNASQVDWLLLRCREAIIHYLFADSRQDKRITDRKTTIVFLTHIDDPLLCFHDDIDQSSFHPSNGF